ncbi:histone-lysine N-methyltransferase SETMAR [Trichonephila clavipes]|nr:histone-lysine N-methyltransferase SETMAR [Trichonephila clavipes]
MLVVKMTFHTKKVSLPFLFGPFTSELQGVKMEVNKEKIRFFLLFFFDKGENANQVAEIANGVYGAVTVTLNYVLFWYRRLGSGIFDVKDAPRTQGGPSSKLSIYPPEIIEFDRHVSHPSITQELKIDHKAFQAICAKLHSKRKSMFWCHINYTKIHDGSNVHLLSLSQTE